MGARPLSRVIQEHIKKPLANEILFGKLRKGGVVKVTIGPLEDGKTGLVLDSIPDSAPVKPKPEAEVLETDGDEAEAPKAKVSKPRAKGGGPAATAIAKSADVTSDAVAELEREPKEESRRKGSTVPKVPKKK